MWLTLIALVVPLGLDTFAIAAALGMTGLSRQDRIRVTALFTSFEAGMPVVGIVLGAVAGTVAGKAAEYVAIAVLIGLGLFMLWPRRDDHDESERVGLLARTRGLAAIGLGISISMDELAIGFTLGLLRFPVLLVIGLIAIQTLVVTQAGLRLGSRIGDAVRERAEQLAGGAGPGPAGGALAVGPVISPGAGGRGCPSNRRRPSRCRWLPRAG